MALPVTGQLFSVFLVGHPVLVVLWEMKVDEEISFIT